MKGPRTVPRHASRCRSSRRRNGIFRTYKRGKACIRDKYYRVTLLHEYRMRKHLTAYENHRPIRDDIDVLHPHMLFLFTKDSPADSS
jgi:hypothetical protein